MEETADTYLPDTYLPEHPWPYLGKLFELEERKDSLYFECLLCLPSLSTIQYHYILLYSLRC